MDLAVFSGIQLMQLQDIKKPALRAWIRNLIHISCL